MTFVITRKCEGVCDAACVQVCPTECIHGPVDPEHLATLSADERKRATVHVQLYINPEDCIFCGACMPECPVDAIYPEDDVPHEFRNDIEANRLFFERLSPARIKAPQG
jgi:ferredoxin